MDERALRRTFLWLFLGCLAITALFAIGAVTAGNLGARELRIVGSSSVVSGDVSASVESNLAAMMEAFSSPNLASFDPMGPEDVDQAQLESDAVNLSRLSPPSGAA